ncbi:iron-sulfur cluster repair di-iron protein [Maribacter hydrothermalis]|uniref:Iron-sulfur cluster repair di-iron protein n=1 Tax=Maribacter hydrothermalis TaxID=1836467 RepID=A0A1B7YZ88_9FLAO|nr:iron-sulfur cluster repair di-iron protein [Maribacter hydrothermalis]APQ16059.1 iron-sulfur cluster repair di-iron protein [Maribacter hydrothermalis]OBR35763.1 iron-sulfur cluster repair di-iron protein [Maribacter hydrothermalis]
MIQTIGEIVALDYRTAQVFKNHKIDFCCRGNRSLQEVALKNNLNIETLTAELKAVTEQNTDDIIDFKSWPLDLLIDYIEKKHHRYVETQSIILNQYLDKLSRVHGNNHPELFQIKELFNASTGELAMHMKKEELILFPFIKKMVKDKQTGQDLSESHFGSVSNPISTMMDEHDNEGERFRTIAKLTNDYIAPADACSTYKVTYSLLQEFENDLHRHIHLENNILFTKAKELEKQLTLVNNLG